MDYILNILDSKYQRRQVNIDKITESVLALTEKNFKEGIS
jgi:hypothetical protein